MTRKLIMTSVIRWIVIDLANAVSLVVMPWRLRPVARSISPIAARYVGGAAMFLQLQAIVLVMFAAVAPTRPTITEHLEHASHAFLESALVALTMTMLYLLYLVIDRRLNYRDVESDEAIRSLAPTVSLLPTIVWVTATVVVDARSARLASGGSSWVDWPIWSVGASCWWLVLIITLPVILGRIALDRETREFMAYGGTCPTCGYCLRKARLNRCPECGDRFIRRPS